jgi:YVTN family beta-propeller protein
MKHYDPIRAHRYSGAPDQYEFVPNRNADYVNVFDVTSGAVVKRIQVSRRPDVTATNADGRYLYVTGQVLAVVDISTLEVVRTLSGDGIAEHYAANVFPDGHRMFVFNYDGSLAVVEYADDPARLAVRKALRINPPAQPDAAVGGKGHFTMDGRHYINANWHTHSVFELDLQTYAVKTVVSSGLSKPDDLVMTADERKGYTASFGTLEQAGNAVDVFDVVEGGVLHSVQVGRHPAGLTMSPDKRFVYVTNVQDGSITAIDTERDEVTFTINAAKAYRAAGITGDWLDIEGITTSADGNTIYAYAVNYGDLVIVEDVGGANRVKLATEQGVFEG